MKGTLSTLLLKRYFGLAVVFVFIIPPLLIGVAVIGPLQAKLANEKSTADTLSKHLETAQNRLRGLQASQGILQNVSASDRTTLSSLLPVGREIPDLIVELNAIAQDSGLTLGTLEITDFIAGPGETLPPAGKALTVAMDWRGGDEKTYRRLIGVVERNARVLDINSIRFAAGVPSLLMNATTYYMDPETVSGTLDPGLMDIGFFSDPRFKSLINRSRSLELEPRGKETIFAR